MRRGIETRRGASVAILAAIVLIGAGCQRSTTKPAPSTPAGPNIQQIEATLSSPSAASAKAMSDPVAYAWLLFLYTNWPASGKVRSQPDPNRKFGDPGPVIWQTWKTSQDLYVTKGQTPLPWNQGPVYQRPALQQQEIDGKVLKDDNGNPVMYEVRLNEDTFNYILGRGLYTQAGQLKLVKGGQPVVFPEPAMEIKASWRILDRVKDKDRITHYLTAKAVYNGKQVLLGLTGLHITSKAVPEWFWCTFEQTENSQTTPIKPLLHMAAAVQKSNQEMQKDFAGTFWAYYQLDGVQSDFVQNPDAAACLQNSKASCLANTQIETYFQGSSSCITCHALASIGKKGSRFNFWNYAGGNQQGYMGKPPSLGSDVPLDFVWSMREAH